MRDRPTDERGGAAAAQKEQEEQASHGQVIARADLSEEAKSLTKKIADFVETAKL
jgi:hypothetical protein